MLLLLGLIVSNSVGGNCEELSFGVMVFDDDESVCVALLDVVLLIVISGSLLITVWSREEGSSRTLADETFIIELIASVELCGASSELWKVLMLESSGGGLVICVLLHAIRIRSVSEENTSFVI